MAEQQSAILEFDRLARLARTDPASFEAWRERTIDQAIARAPAGCRQRLRCLQWRIDRVRELAPSPLAACARISGMMWESLNALDGLYQSLEQPAARTGRKPGTVLAFRPRP